MLKHPSCRDVFYLSKLILFSLLDLHMYFLSEVGEDQYCAAKMKPLISQCAKIPTLSATRNTINLDTAIMGFSLKR